VLHVGVHNLVATDWDFINFHLLFSYSYCVNFLVVNYRSYLGLFHRYSFNVVALLSIKVDHSHAGLSRESLRIRLAEHIVRSLNLDPRHIVVIRYFKKSWNVTIQHENVNRGHAATIIVTNIENGIKFVVGTCIAMACSAMQVVLFCFPRDWRPLSSVEQYKSQSPLCWVCQFVFTASDLSYMLNHAARYKWVVVQ